MTSLTRGARCSVRTLLLKNGKSELLVSNNATEETAHRIAQLRKAHAPRKIPFHDLDLAFGESVKNQLSMMRPFMFSFSVTFLILFFRIIKSSEVYKTALRGDGKTNLYWQLNYKRREVQLEVHAPLNKTSWFAIGFSDYGDLAFGDFCVFWTDWKKKSHLEDVWTSEEGRIFVDEIQNCDNFRYSINEEEVKFAFERKFDTCDPHDYVIEDGTTHVVWAQGAGPLYRLEGVNIFSAHLSGFERTQLLKNENVNESHPSDAWTLEILANKVQVPGVETTYWCHVHKLPDALAKKHHVVQYEPVIQSGNEHLVHHMEVFHCEAGAKDEIPDFAGSCFDEKRPEKTQACKRVLAAWAMGAKTFSYPQEAGLPIGGTEFNRFVMLEIHYNNPELKMDWVDSSGIRFYLTSSLRKYDGGVMELGLEYTDKMAVPPGLNIFRLSGYCVTECTAVGLPDEGIVVFGSQLHTHLLGSRVYTKHIRNGVELPELNRDNHYSTHFQEIRRLKRSVRILPGDALITTCTYKSTERNNVTLGGFSITDEMCVNYIHYYPKTSLEVCKSSISFRDLFGYFNYLRKYENQNTSSKAISENYKAIEWTPLRIEILEDLYAKSGISMQCNQSSGERFPGDWEGLSIPKIYKPLRLHKKYDISISSIKSSIHKLFLAFHYLLTCHINYWRCLLKYGTSNIPCNIPKHLKRSNIPKRSKKNHVKARNKMR